MRSPRPSPLSVVLTTLLLIAPVLAQQAPPSQPLDERYTAEIRKHTTDPCFSTEWVDHLPAKEGIPTPLDVLGRIAGAPDVLSYTDEVHRYMRELAEASPCVEVISLGKSEEGRETILVLVSSEENMSNLAHYREIVQRLADPRGLDEAEARRLIAEGKPIYLATGAIHSPETGSPEMLMELAYRLAVQETPFIKAIRDDMVFATIPVLEPDGRDKRVDLQRLRLADKNARVPRLLYWGKYVAHDNNRDGMLLGLELSRKLMRTYLEWKPQVMHDLHESVAHLYTSTGTGPYNAWIDPILVDEWHVLAYQEITELTKRGVPGVWTHNFYDGWGANYAMTAANAHNSIGRFYETQGAGDGNTRRISSRSSRAWYRPNPPLASTMWSIRNNVNMQQSGILVAMNYVATHKEKFLENFFLKSKRSCEKPKHAGPAAYVFPSDDRRKGQQADLLNALRVQGCEIHRTVRDAEVESQKIPAGSYVIRMDQPYSRLADMLLDRAYFNVEDPRPYDDTGWTLGPLFNVKTRRIEDVAVLDVLMDEVEGEIKAPGGIERLSNGEPVAYLIDNNADNALSTFRFAHPEVKVSAAETGFEMCGVAFNAGTFIIECDQDAGLAETLARAGKEHGLIAFAAERLPDVPTHPVGVPRVAVMHTWTSTQNEGWVRMAMDHKGIPYEYISVHEVRDEPNLREKYDVILFGPSSSDALSIIDGLPKTGAPIPWKATDITPNIGKQDETDDMRGGLELEGVMHLRDFVREGGTFIAIQSSTSVPIHFGLARGVSVVETTDLRVSGTVLAAEVVDRSSPIAYGYDKTLGVYFRRSPVLGFGSRGRGRFRGGRSSGSRSDRLLAGTARVTGRGTVDDPDRVQGRHPDLGKPPEGARTGGRGRRGRGSSGPGPARPRTIIRFAPDHEKLLISGMLAGGDELAGTPTVIDVPLGKGHVVLFGINPMWRHETQGLYPLVFNTMLHFDHLDAKARSAGVSSKGDASNGR